MLEVFDEDDLEPVSVDNDLNVWDMLSILSFPRSASTRLGQSVLVGLILGLLCFAFYPHEGMGLFIVPYCALLTPFVLLVVSYRTLRRSRKNVKASITVSPDGIHATSHEGTRSTYSWHAIRGVERRKEAVSIQLSLKPASYLYIPNRRFSSKTDASKFAAKTNQFWSQGLLADGLSGTTGDALKANAEDDGTDGLAVDVDITFKELLFCDYLLFKMLVIYGVLFCIGSIVFAMAGAWFTACALLVFGLFMVAAPGLGARNKYKNRPNILSGRTTITPQGLRPHNAASGIDTTIAWKRIRKLKVRRGIMFFEFDKQAALAVPLRCFHTDGEAQNFESNARAWWSAARLDKSQDAQINGQTK